MYTNLEGAEAPSFLEKGGIINGRLGNRVNANTKYYSIIYDGRISEMKYRRKYRSSNKVVEPGYITGASNYSMIGAIEKGLNLTKFSRISKLLFY